MKNITILAFLALAAPLSLSSCLFQQAVMSFVRAEYPGQRPPMVIADVNGKPASDKWIAVSSDDLPSPSTLSDTTITRGEGDIPFGINSEFSNIVISPHAPHYQLDYTGVEVGAKVWDPYTRKPFYIPRAYSFN